MSDVTIVMPVFNGKPHLASALDSIMTQSMQDFNVVIVDDGSIDGSAEILQVYARENVRIKVVHQKNAGVTVALNRACELVKTPYIARMDADDISLPDRLERQLGFLRGHREVALLGGGADFINEAGDVLFRVDVPTHNDEIKALLPDRNVFVHSAVVIRRAALLAVGGYRDAFSGMAEDYDLWLRIADRHEVANLAEVIVRYRVHPRQATITKLQDQTRAAMGARLSARLRQSGQYDPFGAMKSVSDETLNQLGVSTIQIEREVAKAARHWARVMGKAGDHDMAAILARHAWECGRGRVVTRHEVGRYYIAVARASLARGHVAHGVFAVVRALRWQPALLGRMLRGGLRPTSRWFRGKGSQPEK